MMNLRIRVKTKKLLGAIALLFSLQSNSSFASGELTGIWQGELNTHGLESFDGCPHIPKLQVEIKDASVNTFSFTPLTIICNDEIIGAVFFGELDVFYNPVFKFSTFYEGNTVFGWMAEGAVSIVMGAPNENLSMDLKLSLAKEKLLMHLTIGTRKGLYAMMTSPMEKKAAKIPLARENDFQMPKAKGFKLGKCDSSKMETMKTGRCFAGSLLK